MESGLGQALSHDISILEALLHYHRNSHGRAVYYRRCSMVLQALARHELANDLYPKLSTDAVEYTNRLKRKQLSDSNERKRDLTQLVTVIQERLFRRFPEVISRIDHASQPLLLEISRGFFLPFCTVALSALARIRTCLVRIGRQQLTQLYELQSDKDLSFLPPIPLESFESYVTYFMDAGRDAPGRQTKHGSQEERNQQLQALGLTLGSKKMDSGGSNNAGPKQVKGNKENVSEVVDDLDDPDDIGEQISTPNLEVASMPKGRGAKRKGSPNDHNQKEGGSRSKRGKQGKKRKSDEFDEGESKASKKKRKKKKKKDFFDNLFE